MLSHECLSCLIVIQSQSNHESSSLFVFSCHLHWQCFCILTLNLIMCFTVFFLFIRVIHVIIQLFFNFIFSSVNSAFSSIVFLVALLLHSFSIVCLICQSTNRCLMLFLSNFVLTS